VTDIPYRIALIVGAGSGISASFARRLATAGLRVGLAARNVDKLAALASETGAVTFAVDASNPTAVARLFAEADDRLGEPDVVHYNASARPHGPIAELDPEAVRRAIEISAFGGTLLHGSPGGRSEVTSFVIRRGGHTPAGRVRACDLGREQRRPPQSRDAAACVSATRRRSRA
jgi:NAD(P)-dependent dehydrogenase (short-subunit alcohol dehydrogenase family)